jgi:hypothetical protein
MHVLLGFVLGIVATVIGIVVWIDYAGGKDPRRLDR